MSIESLFLKVSADQLLQQIGRIEVCLDKLNDDQIWARGGANENAVGNLLLHLNGNVRQWIVASLGGASFERDRDNEFAARGGMTSAELLGKLRGTIEEAAQVIARLTTDQLTRIYEIQGYQPSGLEAVYHVVEHFSYHTGQIIFATKMLTGEDLGFYAHLSSARPAQRVP